MEGRAKGGDQKETDVVTSANVLPESNTGRGEEHPQTSWCGPAEATVHGKQRTRKQQQQGDRARNASEEWRRVSLKQGLDTTGRRERERANAEHSVVENTQGIAERDAMGRL